MNPDQEEKLGLADHQVHLDLQVLLDREVRPDLLDQQVHQVREVKQVRLDQQGLLDPVVNLDRMVAQVLLDPLALEEKQAQQDLPARQDLEVNLGALVQLVKEGKQVLQAPVAHEESLVSIY